MTSKRKGGVKRGESNLASNQLSTCSPQPDIPREIHRVSREEKREERERGDLEEKSVSHRAIKTLIKPLSENRYRRLYS